MAAPASPDPEDRVPSKRPKPDEGQDDQQQQQGRHQAPAGYPPQQIPPQHRYPPPSHYGGPPPHPGPSGGYNMWGPQYTGPHPPPPAGYPMYSQRGPPPPPGERSPPDYYGNGGPPPPRSSQSSASTQTKQDGGMTDDRPPPQPYPGWSPHAPQWHNSSYGPPPSSWQGPGAPAGPTSLSPYPQHHLPHHSGPPLPSSSSAPMHGPPPSGGWGSGRSPPRGGGRLRHDGPYGGRHELDMSYVTCRPVGAMMDDEMEGSSTGGSTKDKGRGSYKCGRCGVPKKGHVCPYQPKLKRRPDEPMPETRNAAIQVEMDEFMTLRRLNLKIQGLPESYAVEPYFDTCMVVGEPAHAVPSSIHPESIAPAILPVGSGGVVDHLQPVLPQLPTDDMGMMGLSSSHPPVALASTPMPLEDELIDPNMEASSSAPSPLPPDIPRSSPPPLLSKDAAVGDDDPIDADDAPLAIDEEKKE